MYGLISAYQQELTERVARNQPKPMITAQQAKSLAEAAISNALEAQLCVINDRVTHAAKEGKYEVIVDLPLIGDTISELTEVNKFRVEALEPNPQLEHSTPYRISWA